MAAPKFQPDTCQLIAELIFDGLSLKDAAREAKVSEKTVKNWLTRGRKEGEGPYADFAVAIEQAREEAASREQPMTEEELRLVVSRAAKGGSVQAQKLYWEMLKRGHQDDPNQKPDDPFAQLDQDDELTAAREARAKAS